MKQLDKNSDQLVSSFTPFTAARSGRLSSPAFNQADLENQIAMIHYKGRLPDRLPAGNGYFALVLCLEGSVTKSINQFSFKLAKGSIHLAQPHIFNIYKNASADLHLQVLFFKRTFLSDAIVREARIESLLEEHLGDIPQPIPAAVDFELIVKLFQKLDNEINTDKLFHGQMMRLVFVELMLEASRLYGERTMRITVNSSRSQQLASTLRRLIEENYLQFKTVQEYADLLFVTPKHLSEVIKQETGLTPLHLIHTRIFQEAKHWLCASDLSIKEIGKRLNFDTGSHFSRFFKQYTGYNPTEFQQIQCAL